MQRKPARASFNYVQDGFFFPFSTHQGVAARPLGFLNPRRFNPGSKKKFFWPLKAPTSLKKSAKKSVDLGLVMGDKRPKQVSSKSIFLFRKRKRRLRLKALFNPKNPLGLTT